MKKRVFILSNSKLPHGDANSNYILYMSKALAYAGWDVIAIGSHNGEDRTEVQVDENLICVNISFQKKKMPMKIKGTLLFGNLIHRELSNCIKCSNSSEWTEAGRSHTGKNFRKEDCF